MKMRARSKDEQMSMGPWPKEKNEEKQATVSERHCSRTVLGPFFSSTEQRQGCSGWNT